MPTESVTEATAIQFPTQSVESSDGLISQHIEQVPSAEGPPSDSCKTAVSQACWEVNVAFMLVVLAGFLILALFYCVLHLWHKLRLAQAGNALEYFGFYHMANYSLKHQHEPTSLPSVNTDPPVQVPPCYPPQTVVPENSHPVIPPLLPPPPLLSSRPPSAVPLPHPIIYTTPPSPQSDAEVYSRIGTLRPARHSSVSQTQVVLFEHSSL
ncbi:uncharacterized protein LOC108278465 [Ictalurus punctatus]|uniref:Uncharacterized protein LOC108278465 n=1 Tax=Ictalurus punctatus TaxID=7998 RepID=A0A2D0SXV2_ICTPU|nr:uncharacterized protein LOC108278465 [Ictalurus punctatus]